MIVTVKTLNGSEIAYGFEPEHYVGVTNFYKWLVAQKTIKSFSVKML